MVYKDAENISDDLALTSFPLLLVGYASSWWQGVKNEATTFEMAIDILRKAFSPPKPDWRIFLEINLDKQKPFEPTDSFVCRKRRLFAQLSEKLSETTMLDILYSQIQLTIRKKVNRESITSFQELMQKARDVEMILNENKEIKSKPKTTDTEEADKSAVRCTFCRKKNHTAETCFKKIEADRKGKPKLSETTLNCYGCGLAGYYL